MTLARIVRRKAARLARWSWAGGTMARLVDLNPCSKATAKQWLNPLSGRPDTLSALKAVGPRQLLLPKIDHRDNARWAQFPIARWADAAPPPAISCLGASRTPAVGARVDRVVMQASEDLHKIRLSGARMLCARRSGPWGSQRPPHVRLSRSEGPTA